jgi:hypothetical protein
LSDATFVLIRIVVAPCHVVFGVASLLLRYGRSSAAEWSIVLVVGKFSVGFFAFVVFRWLAGSVERITATATDTRGVVALLAFFRSSGRAAANYGDGE